MSQTSFDQYETDCDHNNNSNTTNASTEDLQPTQSVNALLSQKDLDSFHPMFSTEIGKYPTEKIARISKSDFRLKLTTPNKSKNVAFSLIAGSGGMGHKANIENQDSVQSILKHLYDTPVLLTDGGSLIQSDIPYTICNLKDSELKDGSISVTLDIIYEADNNLTNSNIDQLDAETITRTLGSYQISVPRTPEDFINSQETLSHWCEGRTTYLFNTNRKQKQAVTAAQETFTNATIADKLSTPIYETDLEVVSETFDVCATKQRKGIKSLQREVTAIVVSNPNGGYYQLGIEKDSKHDDLSMPSCYLSGSQNTPPTPNTSFRFESKFDADELSRTAIPHPTTPEKISPDEEILNSPLKEPKMQTQPKELQYVGKNTDIWLLKNIGPKTTADKIAHCLFNDGDIYDDETTTKIKEKFESLPNSDKIFAQLEEIASTIQ